MSLELLIAAAIALLCSCGVYLVLRARTFPVVLGLSLLSYAVNLFIFVMGRLAEDVPPIADKSSAAYADPLPQALVLTAIVIGFGMTGFLVELAVRARDETGTDHVDGVEREAAAGARTAARPVPEEPAD
jgi:multicomponent K+:H+ antiporter subunit C